MAKNIETRVDIPANLAQTWAILSDLAAYSHWSDRTHFTAQAQVGQRITMRVQLFKLWLSVPVTLNHLDQEQGLRWTGGLPGLFTGSHYFRLQDNGAQGCTLIQGEDFTGLLVPLILPLVKTELMSLYYCMNQNLWHHCERQHSLSPQP